MQLYLAIIREASTAVEKEPLLKEIFKIVVNFYCHCMINFGSILQKRAIRRRANTAFHAQSRLDTPVSKWRTCVACLD